ncbi:MAG: SDR family oxidoreductase [Patescibacteria group bacterium]
MKSNTKFALITGASSDIGKSIAITLAQNGYNLILTSKTTGELTQAAGEVSRVSGSSEPILTIPTDLTNLKEIQKLTDQVKLATPRLDVLVNVAGVYHDGSKAFYKIDYDKYSTSQVLTTMAVGLTAPMLLIHALIPLMPPGSRIMNISGTFEGGAKGWLPYYVSKKALEDLTIGLSQELKDKGILVNCISPSDTYTASYSKFFRSLPTQAHALYQNKWRTWQKPYFPKMRML